MKRALAALALTVAAGTFAAGAAAADPRDGRFNPTPAPYAAPYAPPPVAPPAADLRRDGDRGYDRRDERRDEWRHDRRSDDYDFRFGYDGHGYDRDDRRAYWDHARDIRRGDQLTPWQFRRADYIRDFRAWRLAPPPRGTAWMQLGRKVMLVRVYDGYVLDVIRV